MSGVATRYYVDDGVRGADVRLLAAIPDAVGIAAEPAGLRYKRDAWHAWSPSPMPQLPGIQCHAPDDGLVIVGAPAGAVAAIALVENNPVVAGGPAFQLRLAQRVCARVENAVVAVEHAVSATASAEVAQREGLAVIKLCVESKIDYLQRVFPPQVVSGALSAARAALSAASARILGWTRAEGRAARAQAAMRPMDGGLTPHPDGAGYAFLASWWGAAQLRDGGSPADVVLRSATDDSPLGRLVQATYVARVAVDSSLPPTLAGLAARLSDVSEVDAKFFRKKKPDGSGGGFRWQRWLGRGAHAAARAQWERAASRGDKHRIESMSGKWVLFGAPGIRQVLVSQLTYRVAMRLRFGLKLPPALPLPAERRCAHTTRERARCNKPLDAYAHHAVACGAGGGFVARHNAIVNELAAELRRMGFRVRTEVWLDDLLELHNGRLREARMDLVVQSSTGTTYIDVTCYHPFTGGGRRRTRATGGTPEAQEEHKHDRYPVRRPGSRRRVTLARFVPVAVSSYGRPGPAALKLFEELELEARESRAGYRGKSTGWLAALVAEVAVHATARMAINAFSAPDGQERAHLFGRAASAPGA